MVGTYITLIKPLGADPVCEHLLTCVPVDMKLRMAMLFHCFYDKFRYELESPSGNITSPQACLIIHCTASTTPGEIKQGLTLTMAIFISSNLLRGMSI